MHDLKSSKSQLNEELRKIDERLSAFDNDPLRIGLLGARGSCKSSLLAAWYLFRNKSVVVGGQLHQVDISPDEPTIVYLEQISKNLLQTGTTSPNTVARPETIRFGLTVDNHKQDVETIDYAGEFVQAVEDKEEREIAERARRFLRACDVVICLFRWNETSVSTINALDICLRDHKPYVLLALTKFDETGTPPKTNEEFQDRLDGLLKQNRTLREIKSRIDTLFPTTDTSYIIPVAPLGGDFSANQSLSGRRPPLERHDLQPLNIYAPLLRALKHKQKQKMLLLETRQNIVNKLRAQDAEATGRLQRAREQQRAEMEQKRIERVATATWEFSKIKEDWGIILKDPQRRPDDSFERLLVDTERIMQIAEKSGDTQLAEGARQLRREIKSESSERTLTVLSEECDLLSQEADSFLNSSIPAWLISSAAELQTDLEDFDQKAREAGRAELADRSAQLAARIRRRRSSSFRSTMLIILLAGVSMVLYVMYQFYGNSLTY